MNDKDIFDLADSYADWDDFGRWVFSDSDNLIEFVDAVASRLQKVHETSMRTDLKEGA